MIKQNFIIDELEKKRILNLHESRTKNLYLIKEGSGLLKTDFPPCVQLFGEPTASSDGKYGGIDGGAVNGISYNWTGYRFFSNFRVKKPDGNMGDYFCKGDQPVLGTKQVATKGSKTTSTGLGGSILKIGSSGDAVKQVQNRVVVGGHGDGQTVGGNANCGKDINSCDGKYGRGTMDAVKKLQTSAGITSDGVVGDETWQQLFGGQAPEQPKVTTAKSEVTTAKSEYDNMTAKYGRGFK
jgi:peptidoglycan hydrolase-like protein with peptidoglycan-binding domain